jgi:hypothetical protein
MLLNDPTKNKLIVIAALVGFFGDIGLQWIDLPLFKTYFAQHGPLESTLIASGFLSLLYVLYLYPLSSLLSLSTSTTSPLSLLSAFYFSLFILVGDLILRKTRVFKSLDYFYDHLNYFQSGIPGAVLPALIPFGVFWILKN